MSDAVKKKQPVVIGVTGHRNIVEEDRPLLKKSVAGALNEILDLVKKARDDKDDDVPVVMLNGLAQGADMLCADVALDMGVPVYAVLPCELTRYKKSFDEEQRKKLPDYLNRAKKMIITPDIEDRFGWFENAMNMDKESYEYRQLGIYIAKSSHILIALWDGKPPKSQYGCGTVEVIDFAIKNNYFGESCKKACRERVAAWVKARRQGDGSVADVKLKYLSALPDDFAGEQNGGDYSKTFCVSERLPQFMTESIKKFR